ncbi:LysR family transcriptional regulator [uncultured Ferrimonas sp.]|uniref:LysR family transcriptional regulator n=1 Tax=uncultured Ferrimonas sp. TaxID=432640 RepID=UPI002631BC85|nr:LysR family transcriptional regulator [uncultured Ferrimonas sp.]
MRTTDLETLIMVAEYGSLSKAAHAQCLTQSAVSQRIKNLERHFNQPLLQRGPPLRLTSKGEQVVQCGRQMLTLQQQMQSLPATNSNELRLWCTPIFGFGQLPTILQCYQQQRQQHANLSVLQGLPEDGVNAINRDQVDIAVLDHHHPLPAHQGMQQALPPQHILFVIAAGQPVPQSISQLQQHRLHTARPGCSSRLLLESNLATHHSDLQQFASVAVIDDLHLALQSLQTEGGVAFMAHSLVQAQLQRGELVGFEIPGFNHYLHRSLLLQPSLNDAAQQFIERLQQQLLPAD